jgi:hypothetical protein
MKNRLGDFVRTLGVSLGLSGLIMAAVSVPAVAQNSLYDCICF